MGFGFGNIVVRVPAGRTRYTERLDLRKTHGLFLCAELDMQTDIVTWELVSIDPETGQPRRNPLAGSTLMPQS